MSDSTMSDSGEEIIQLFDAAIGTIKHENYNDSFLIRAGKVTSETLGYPPEVWGAFISQNRRPYSATTPPAIHKGLYNPVQGPCEIRVLEIKPGSGNETLQGSLHHCSVEGDRMVLGYRTQWAVSTMDFTTPIYYTALSYTWGPQVFEATIECDGYEKKITKSLEAALRRFRQPRDPIMMWIDQICINQDDEAEKKKQIRLMGRIYERARNTVIWLGEAENESGSALQLIERITSCLHYTLSEVDLENLERIDLPASNSRAWKDLWDLLSRPWFTRVWIIQEAILSAEPGTWFACGNRFMPWATLTTACIYLETCGISRKMHEKFGPGLGQNRDVCEVVWSLESQRLDYRSGPGPELFKLLTKIRNSNCYDPKDRIYGLLGVCEDGDRQAVIKYDKAGPTAVDLYVNMATHQLLKKPIPGMNLTQVLAAVDHESLDLPSWVPDWRVPPRMYPLGLSFAHSVYQASGRFKQFSNREDDGKKPLARIHDKELIVQGVFFDTLAETSPVFTEPDLTYDNPAMENKVLLTAVAFVSQIQHSESPYTIFTALWKTLIAGKNGDGMLRCPETFAEVFSFLLDQTTGKSPSVAGQTYSVRQKRPKGKGGLELSSLKTRTLGQTFEEARTALRRALKNRRLGITSRGYLGLFPWHVSNGDIVYVFETCALPFTLRPAENDKFRYIGECFVHGIMEGEAVEPEDTCMVDVTLI